MEDAGFYAIAEGLAGMGELDVLDLTRLWLIVFV
jgi:hypothetical protein